MMIASMILAACGGPAATPVPEATATTGTTTEAPTTAAVEPTKETTAPEQLPRNETLYIGGLQWQPPVNFNPMFDGQLTREEITSVFSILGDAEIAAMIRRHPFKTDIQAIDLSEDEQKLRLYLKAYIEQLASNRQEKVFEIMNHLIDD
jgi:hypothetical protein